MQGVEHQPQIFLRLHPGGDQLGGQLAEILAQRQPHNVLPQLEKHLDGIRRVDYVLVPPLVQLQAGIAQQAGARILAIFIILGPAGKGPHHALVPGQHRDQPVTLADGLLPDDDPLGLGF